MRWIECSAFQNTEGGSFLVYWQEGQGWRSLMRFINPSINNLTYLMDTWRQQSGPMKTVAQHLPWWRMISREDPLFSIGFQINTRRSLLSVRLVRWLSLHVYRISDLRRRLHRVTFPHGLFKVVSQNARLCILSECRFPAHLATGYKRQVL